jgi:hypothetical protein
VNAALEARLAPEREATALLETIPTCARCTEGAISFKTAGMLLAYAHGQGGAVQPSVSCKRRPDEDGQGAQEGEQ